MQGVRRADLRAAVVAAMLGLLAVSGLVLVPASGSRRSAVAASRASAAARLQRAFGRLPMSFETNRGQTDRRVDFVARGQGYTLFLTPRGSVLSLVSQGRRGKMIRGSVLDMTLGGASHPHGTGVGRLPGSSNYLIGKNPRRWHTGVPSYRDVVYRGVYPGVSLVYHGGQGRLEYDFHLAPGADPARIGLAFSGATALALDRRGNLLLRTPGGVVRQDRPIAYQGRQRVAIRFVVHGHAVGFRLGRYDHSRPLVIDPVLVYATYLGGDNTDEARGIVVDSSGDAYVTGFTYSVDFPTTSGAFQLNRGGNITPGGIDNAFVSKLNASGTALVYSTYLGGSRGDDGQGIAIDASGRAYVTGRAQSSNFPTTVNAYQATPPSNYSGGFLSVLTPSGSGLDYSTFLGGTTGYDSSLGVAVDASGDAYLTGFAASTDFPVAAPGGATPLQATATGSGDAFVAKLDPSRSGAASLVYSTYLGGSGFAEGLRIAVDSGGNAYVAGETDSTDFPTTASAFQASNAGGVDAFVTKVNPTGTALVYSTYLGGSGDEDSCGCGLSQTGGGAMAVDSAGHAYVTGTTRSSDFPTTPFAFQKTPGPGFVAKLAVDGSSLVYSSYLSSEGDAIAVDGSGAAYVAGRAAGSAFPVLDPVVAPLPGGGADATLTKIRPDGTGLLYSTTIGGNGDSQALAVAVDSSGAAYLVGVTLATDLPTVNPIQATALEDQGIFFNGFVAEVAPTPASVPLVTALSSRSGDTNGGDTVVISGHGFTGATAVKFGSVPAASFTVDSDTQITAVSPPHAAVTVPATVTSPQGTSPANPVAQFAYGLGEFAATASPPVSASGVTPVQLGDGRVLVIDGNSGASELYDPSTGTWSATGSPDYVLYGATATLLPDGKVLLAGGDDYANYGTPYAELYDPVTGTWSPTGQMNFLQDYGETATLLRNGKVLVADPSGAELYDPTTGTWTTTGSMNTPRSFPTATLLDGPACTGSSQPSYCGDVVVTGGYNLASTELYNPTTGTWSYAAPLPVAVNFANAVPLPNGDVLVAGGDDEFNLSTTSAEVYDPATNHWSLTSPMLTPTAGAAATVLANGQVLLAGGIIGSVSGLDSAEVYDPTRGTWTSAGLTSAYQESYSGPGYPPLAAPLTTNCGANCGKVLVTDGTTADLYTPHTPPGPPPAPPANLSPPTVTGLAVQGDTLTETHGSWSHSPTGYALAWLRCDTAGNACAAISGARANTYTLTSADVGSTVRVQETASNAGGTAAPARSVPTAIVQPAGPPQVTGYRLTNRTFAVASTATPLFATAAKRHPKGTTFNYTLSQAATIKIAISQRLPGRRAGKRCVARTKRRHVAKCTRVLSRGTLTRTSHQGANTVAFSGRIGSKPLRPGRYQATLTATNAAGKKTSPQTVYFTVVAR